jgi:hypothetical protein
MLGNQGSARVCMCVQVQKEDFITWHHVRVGATLHRNINRVCVCKCKTRFV